VGLIGRRIKIGERFGIAVPTARGRSAEELECRQRGDPRGDGGSEAFGEEGTKGLVLPGLNVTSGPVVEQAQTKDVIRRFGDRNRGSKRIGLPNIEGQLEFVVEGSGGAEAGAEFVAWRTGLAMGALDGDPAGKDRRGPSVVTDGDVFVVGQKRLVGTKDATYASGVVNGGVEVSVVGDMDRFEQGGSSDGVKGSFNGQSAGGLGVGMEERGERLPE
jgi:hypothetical protein